MSQSDADTDEQFRKLDAALEVAQKDEDGEKLATLKLMCAIGLIRVSKLPKEQIADFATAAIVAFRSAIEVAVLTRIIEKHQKTGVPMDVVVAMRALGVMNEDIKNQKKLATLTALFDEPTDAAEGQANG